MAAGVIVFVDPLNKETTIEPIPLMRKKVGTLRTLFHMFLLISHESQ